MHGSSTSSGFMPPLSSFPPSANHSSVPSQSTFGSSYRSNAMDGARESEENPAGAYLGNFSYSSAHANGLMTAAIFPNPATLPPWFSDMDTDGAATAPPNGDHLIAQLSQHEFRREDEEFHSSWLAGYGQHLRSLRCPHCSAPMKIGAAELIQRTKNMLKHDRTSSHHTHRWACHDACG